MSKKYIFFKRLQTSQYDSFYDQLSRLNLSSFLRTFSVVDNILQIVQIPDLRMLIFKNLNLQKELTRNLPHHPPHGYLWSGEQWPDIEALLASASTVQHMFLFYKLGDMAPPFFRETMLKAASSYEIYNWQIFQVPAFPHLLTHFRIASAHTEVEIEKRFRKIISDPSYTPSAMPGERENTRLTIIQGLVSHLLNSSKTTLSILSSIPFDLSKINWRTGTTINYESLDPMVQYFMEAYLSRFVFSRESFSRLISNYMHYIRQLILENPSDQSDLFLSKMWESFSSYWEDEKKRLPAIVGLQWNDLTLKVLTAARFLLDSAPFDMQAAGRSFLQKSLIDALKEHLTKKPSVSFMDKLHQELRKNYLAAYAQDHMNSFFKLQHPPQTFSRSETPCDTILGIFSSSDPYEKNPWPQIRNIFQFPEKSNPLFDVSEEISKEGDRFRLFNVYGQQVLTRLLSENKLKACEHVFLRWLDVLSFLKSAGERLKPGGRGALYLDSAFTKPGDRINEILVFQSFFDEPLRHELKLENTLFADTQKGRPAQFSILIFVKPSDSD